MSDRENPQNLKAATLYDVFKGRMPFGGKRVAVYPDAAGDLQARAAAAGAPLSVFTERLDHSALRLRVFTPTKEKGESDSASIAACQWYQDQGDASDVLELEAGGQRVLAQLCGNEWLLEQGHVTVLRGPATPFAGAVAAHIAQTQRPNLLLEVPTLAALDDFRPDAQAISELGRQTDTTGLVLYTFDIPTDGPQRLADVSFRAFGPLKGFLEDAASSNMFACLTGVLIQRQKVPADELMIRGAQRKPGSPSVLAAQFGTLNDPIWVGGAAGVATAAD